MELTQKELAYVFNCVSEHGTAIDQNLKDLKGKIIKKPGTFFRLVPEIEGILDDLIIGYGIQLKMLPDIKIEDDKKVVEKGIRKGLGIAKSCKSELNTILDKFDKDEDE